MKKIVIAGVSLMAIIAASVLTLKELKSASAAYIYGYPLVLMDKTRQAMFAGGGQINQFNHVQKFPDHTFRNVVRPNNDTLYSIAWFDLGKEAMVLSVPAMPDRYYVMPLMDAWTNVVASAGTRETGIEAGNYLITGPSWTGEIPDTMEHLASPTTMAWMIGRIQTNSTEDIPNITALQTGFKLASLSDWNAGIEAAYTTSDDTKADNSIDPYQQITEMDSATFFTALSKLLITQATLEGDTDILQTIAAVGIIPGELYNPADQSWLQAFIHDYALNLTRQKIIEKLEERGNLENGWVVLRDIIGNYGNSYQLRTGIANIGLGALTPAEAVYPNTNLDSDGKPLSGDHSYTIHFDAGAFPPADAFWSITMYDQDGFLTDNPIRRYTIGDRDALDFNDDGSLDIIVQHAEPAQGNNNWLPAPADNFALTMRLYMPEESFLDGSWKLPPVDRQ